MSEPVQIPTATPQETYEALRTTLNAQLVDVRTPYERFFVGAPDLSAIGKEPVNVPLKEYNAESSTFASIPTFVETVEAKVPSKDTPLYFMCRVGGRSTEGARLMHARGYTNVFSIKDGFEGPFINPESCKQRRTATGWKNTPGCPWKQS